MHGQLPLQLSLDGRPCETHSSYAFAGGGTVLTIATVLPVPGLALELISTYVGCPGVLTHATHLTLGPAGSDPRIEHLERAEPRSAPARDPRACAYDHAHELIEQLTELGYQASLQLDEHTFTALEQVE